MMHYFLALEVWKNIDDIFLCEGKNVVDIMNRFRMMDCNTIATTMASNMNLLCDTASAIVDAKVNMKIISLLMHFMNTRPYIYFPVNTLCQCMVETRHVIMIAVNHVLKFLKGMITYGIRYAISQRIILQGYVDSHWSTSVVDRKRTSGCFFSLWFCMISWFRKK